MTAPETRYVRNGDIAIAYQVHGSGEHDLLFSGSVASNLETVQDLPEASRFFERLERFARVIRFDRRDTGVSDPIRDDLALEAHAADALAVMDVTGSRRPFVLGALDGARSLAVLAATDPGRVAGLIAISPTARGGPMLVPELREIVSAAITDPTWPRPLLEFWAPSLCRNPESRRRFERYVRTSATPRQAERLLSMSMQSNVTEVLSLVQAPTLVLHPTGAMLPAEPVREFAELIDGAVYEEIEGDAAVVYGLDVDWLAERIEAFMTGTAPKPASNRVLATIMFTDLVGSTERAAELGDREWTSLLSRHLAGTGAAIVAAGGETVKTLGDGVLALFTGPAQAVRCAGVITEEAAALGIGVRIGIHTGEVERSRDDVAGLAVHLAARIMARADAGEILVSRTVRDLVVGSGLGFVDRGEHELKGISERWAVYAAE